MINNWVKNDNKNFNSIDLEAFQKLPACVLCKEPYQEEPKLYCLFQSTTGYKAKRGLYGTSAQATEIPPKKIISICLDCYQNL